MIEPKKKTDGSLDESGSHRSAGWLFVLVSVLVGCGPSGLGREGDGAGVDDHRCFQQVVAGGSRTFAILPDGTAWGWGGNTVGQLGIGTNEHPQPTPVQLEDLGRDTVTIGVGSNHACAITVDGRVWCWGSNNYGQLGSGGTGYRRRPGRVRRLTGAVEVVAGSWHTCARDGDGKVWCWGHGGSGGGDSNEIETEPVEVAALGSDNVQISAGSNHTCAVKTNGSLWCWGRLNNRGSIGDGTTEIRRQPVQVTALGVEVAAVRAGGSRTCALKHDGTLWCWGDNRYGAVGDGTTESPKTLPVQVAALGNEVAEFDAGGTSVCARKTDDTVWCWGRNDSGEIGDGTIDSTCEWGGDWACGMPRPTPVRVESLGTDSVEIAVGGAQACAAKRDGTLWCWGQNRFGSVGDGTTDGEPCPWGLNSGVCRPSPVLALIDCEIET